MTSILFNMAFCGIGIVAVTTLLVAMLGARWTSIVSALRGSDDFSPVETQLWLPFAA